MEDVFNQILYLIPVAIIIAVRLINAKNKSAAKQQQQQKRQQAPEGGIPELIRRIQEAQGIPTHNTPQERSIRYVDRDLIEKRELAEKKKKQAPKKVKTEPKKELKPLFTEEQEKVQSPADVQASERDNDRDSRMQTGIIVPGLTPLQQAVVWAEVLGQPRGA